MGGWGSILGEQLFGFYVVDKALYNAHLATEEDLIKVKEITENSVLLKPTAKDAYRVALKVFKRDYKKF